MINKQQLVEVKNRDNGGVSYKVDDLGIRRDFAAGEVKTVTAEELLKLSYAPGGKELLQNYLVITDKAIAEEILNDTVEPEYFYSKEDVIKLLNTGSEDQLLDCLDFAPEGVIDMVKQVAVDIKLNDFKKREIIKQKTGFNVDTAIMIDENDGEEVEDTTKARRAPTPEVQNTPTESARRVVIIPNKK